MSTHDVAKHTGVPSFKPETSAYYPMSHMSHNHLATASSVVVPQLSSYALSVGAAAAGAVEIAANGVHGGADLHEGQAPYMGPYGTIGLNEAMYISAPSVHQSQNGLMNTGLPANSMMAHYSGLGEFSSFYLNGQCQYDFAPPVVTPVVIGLSLIRFSQVRTKSMGPTIASCQALRPSTTRIRASWRALPSVSSSAASNLASPRPTWARRWAS